MRRAVGRGLLGAHTGTFHVVSASGGLLAHVEGMARVGCIRGISGLFLVQCPALAHPEDTAGCGGQPARNRQEGLPITHMLCGYFEFQSAVWPLLDSLPDAFIDLTRSAVNDTRALLELLIGEPKAGGRAAVR
ncbi:MAG: hypothetical protein U5Q16_01195 [Gammaproteobacteria bacterium]|nr:hypothetical protein [Gammaproteobacteria bacterium]